MSSAYAQLLSVGLVWISVHCAGMCGPLLMGLDVAGVARGSSATRGALRIIVYQLGRATTLATLGAFAGLAGHGLTKVLQPAGAVMALVLGVLVLGTLVWQLRPKPTTPPPVRVRTRLEGRGSRGSIASRILGPLSLSSSMSSAWLLGVVMGFLPCMIVVWALGLAATTTSIVDGAAVMVLLVAMTTPMLLGVTLLPRIIPQRARSFLPRALMVISATWLVMIGLAGLEVVPHAHVLIGDFTMMLW